MGNDEDEDRYDDEPARRRSRDGYEDDYDDDTIRRRSRDDDYGRPRKHSRFGVVSFIVVMVAGAIVFICFSIVGAITTEAGNDLDPDDPETMLLLLGTLLGLGLGLIGVILGVVGCFERKRIKIFAILGLIIGSLMLLGSCGLMAIGALAAAAG